MPDKIVDLSKAMHEFKRMQRCEIPFDQDYLQELIEYDGDEPPPVEFSLNCGLCGAKVEWVECPECRVTRQPDCFLCEGEGGFFDCPRCNGEDGLLL